MKLLKKIPFFICMLLLTITFVPASVCSQKKSGNPDLALNPEEKMMLNQLQGLDEKELLQLWDTIVTEVDKEAQKLPPEEREKFLESFWSEVSQEAVKLEEKIKYEEQATKAEEPEEIAPVAQPAKVEKPVEKPKPPVDSKIEQTVKLIDSLLSNMENLLRKIQGVPDFNAKMQDWAKKGALQNIPAGAQFNSVKTQLESFTHTLYKLKERDPKTKEFKYIDELSKKTTVINNLSQINSVLSSKVSTIEIPELGASLTEKSKVALQASLNSLLEALYRMHITTALEEVITAYDKRAGILKAETEADIKAAQTAAAKPGKTVPVTVAGQAPAAPSRYRAQPDFGGGFGGGGMRGGFGDIIDMRSSGSDKERGGSRDGAQGGGEQPAPGGKAGGKEGAGKPGDGKKAEGSKEEKPNKDEGAKGKKPDEGKKDDKKDEKKDDKKPDVAQKRIDNFALQVENVADVILDHRKLRDIDHFALDASEPVDPEIANEAIPDAVTKTRKALSTLRGTQRSVKKLTEKDQKDYADEVKAVIKENEKLFTSLIDRIERIKQNEGAVNNDKQYAYLGAKKVPTTPALVNTIANPASLYELQKLLQELLETADRFKDSLKK